MTDSTRRLTGLDGEREARGQSYMASSGLDDGGMNAPENGRKAALGLGTNYSVHPFQNDAMETSYCKDGIVT